MEQDEPSSALNERDLEQNETDVNYPSSPPPYNGLNEEDLEQKETDVNYHSSPPPYSGSNEEDKENLSNQRKLLLSFSMNENLTETNFENNLTSSSALDGLGLDGTDTSESRDSSDLPYDTNLSAPYVHSSSNNSTQPCRECPRVATPSPELSKHRGQWGNHCEYFLTSLGVAVGLGNIWRFPFQVYANGGSTFMIAYFLMLFLVGLPMFFMEMVLGQYSGTSVTKVYARLAPGLKGLGYAILSVPAIINTYYTVIMAWAFFYMFSGFTDVLPWKFCGNEYNSINCFSSADDLNCRNITDTTFWNNTCTDIDVFCQWHGLTFVQDNYTHCFNELNNTYVTIAKVAFRKSSAEEFFNRRMLNIGEIGVESTWENYGDMQWEVVACLALSWALIALCLIKGVSSYGKIAYFVTLFPYVVLITLLIIISQEDGFVSGVEFYLFNPDWERLASDITVWMAAAGQIFYSLSIAVGSQLLLASYNHFNTNCHRDAVLIGACNSLTSVFGGFVVFGILGVLANKNQVAIEDVVTSGTGLAFIAYPDAIANLDGWISPLLSFLFFLMLVLLALSTLAATWEPLVAAIIDEFPFLYKYRPLIMILSCIIAFLCGVSCCFQSGILMFDMMNKRTANAIVIMGLVEVLVLWSYGLNRFFDNIEEMKIWMPTPLKWFWKTCWGFITPAILFSVMINHYIHPVFDYYLDYIYPFNIQVLGWFMELFPVAIFILISICIVIYNYFHGRSIAFFLPGPLMSPSAAWGPREDRPRTIHTEFDNHNRCDSQVCQVKLEFLNSKLHIDTA